MPNPSKMKGIQVFEKGDGARRRNDATSENQKFSRVQPSGLTDGIPPSPADAVPNHFGRSRKAKSASIWDLLNGAGGDKRIQRFWSYVQIGSASECWPWRGAKTSDGYGSFKITSYRGVTASRVAMILSAGDEPAGLQVLHRCDNPACCNPAHLRFGTVAENMRDKVLRGRARGRFSAPLSLQGAA